MAICDAILDLTLDNSSKIHGDINIHVSYTLLPILFSLNSCKSSRN